MLTSVLVLFLVAALAPITHRVLRQRAGVVLAVAPGLLFAHFARMLEPVGAGEAIVAVSITAGAVAVVRARTLLFAVAALGVVGYGVAVVFLLFGGPDLALTQFAIETLSVLLFVLVLGRLPRLRSLSPPAERIRDGVVVVSGGAFVAALLGAAMHFGTAAAAGARS